MANNIIETWENGLILRMIEEGIEETKAIGIVSGYFAEQREYYDGVRTTISLGYTKHSPAKIRKARAEYNGRNRLEIQKKYEISKTHFYRKIAK